jgi:hypothetical protein
MGHLIQVGSLLPGVGEHVQVSFTLGTLVVLALALFGTGFLLGVLGCHWMVRQRRRQNAAAELKRKARA